MKKYGSLLVYHKLNTKFENFGIVNKVENRFELDWVNVQTYFYTKSFLYYDYNMHNFIVHKYFLRLS
jgi:hypothetical protein